MIIVNIIISTIMFSAAITFNESKTVYADESNDNVKSDRIIVSLGDSYSSGEGLSDYGDSKTLDEMIKDSDWLGHRSKNAWGGQLVLNDDVSGTCFQMSQNRNTHWYFAASSGAETKHCRLINEENRKFLSCLNYVTVKSGTSQVLMLNPLMNKSYDALNNLISAYQKKEFHKNLNVGCAYLPPQLDIFNELKNQGKKADYVTLTIGGNDLGFSTIVGVTVLGSQYIMPAALPTLIAFDRYRISESGDMRKKLKDVYKDIYDTAGSQATIIVAGYPELFNPKGYKNIISENEATEINKAILEFNEMIADIVEECKGEGIKIEFADVIGGFENHGAYSDDPYINNITMPPRKDDLKDFPFEFISACSIHPNEKGAKIYADCVQEKINKIESVNGVAESVWLYSDSDYMETLNEIRKEKSSKSSDFSYYYSLYDVNDDDIKELIIWEKYYSELDGDYVVNGIELYTIVDAQVKRIQIPEKTKFNQFFVTDKGVLLAYMSDVPADTYYDLFLCDLLDGGDLAEKEAYTAVLHFEQSEDIYEAYTHFTNGSPASITESEYWDGIGRLFSLKIDIDKIDLAIDIAGNNAHEKEDKSEQSVVDWKALYVEKVNEFKNEKGLSNDFLGSILLDCNEDGIPEILTLAGWTGSGENSQMVTCSYMFDGMKIEQATDKIEYFTPYDDVKIYKNDNYILRVQMGTQARYGYIDLISVDNDIVILKSYTLLVNFSDKAETMVYNCDYETLMYDGMDLHKIDESIMKDELRQYGFEVDPKPDMEFEIQVEGSEKNIINLNDQASVCYSEEELLNCIEGY